MAQTRKLALVDHKPDPQVVPSPPAIAVPRDLQWTPDVAKVVERTNTDLAIVEAMRLKTYAGAGSVIGIRTTGVRAEVEAIEALEAIREQPRSERAQRIVEKVIDQAIVATDEDLQDVLNAGIGATVEAVRHPVRPEPRKRGLGGWFGG